MDNVIDIVPPKVQFISSASRGSLTQYSESSTFQVFQSISEEQERCAKQIISFVMKDDFVEGEISKTQLYLEKLYLRDPFLFRESFTRAWVKLFGLGDEEHIYTLASVSSCLPYEWLEHHGITLLLGCSSHPSVFVNEACLRLAEAWEQHDHVSYLKKMRAFDYPWLEEYRVNVIQYLEGLSK